MKILKTEFCKNGLDYTLLKRTDKIALFQLGHLPDPDGYEVCRIYIMRPHKAFGFVRQDYVVAENASDTELILEYQAV